MISKELRKKYIEFFKEKGHKEIPSASLVPENDPTVLFTTAGMHPLVPYLMGENHPVGKRLVNIQKCVRTGDIDDVGDSTHNTFFEMLGNWSLGDYFKKDSIKWSWEFLTDKKWLGIDPEKIKVTVFEGDDSAPRDDESIKIWQECFKKSGISVEVYDKQKKNNETARIFPLPKKDNWWGPAGETGPCGPDTEIFIDLGKPVNFKKCPNGNNCKPGCHCGRYVEIWNNVFMEYERRIRNQELGIKNNKKYEYVVLPQKNVDTGMGLERTLAVLNGFDNVYETDVLAPIIEKIKSLGNKAILRQAQDDNASERIIADHIRTSVFMISDGVAPSNLDRGYILRRLLRRAIRHGNLLKMPNGFLLPLAEVVINIYKDFYPLEKNKSKILEEIKKEEEKFEKTIENGIKALKKIFGRVIGGVDPDNLPKGMVLEGNKMRIDGSELFHIYETHGLPIEISQEIMKGWGVAFDEQTMQEANKAMKKHQQLSRTASAGKFKGGLADAGEETVKLHTAAHLLLESLRRVLGDHIFQKGSNINAERLRFDFSHPDKLTDKEKQKVEDLVNEQIQKKLLVNCEEMSLEEAKKINAMGVFENKYGEKVKVYTIGRDNDIFSREICGGPHIKNTSELGKFKIKKEQSSSSGVRRIKAVLE
jgi:alanyl-tRNA synthetase